MGDQTNSRIQVWYTDYSNTTQTISVGVSNPYSLLVTAAGDIYVNYAYCTFYYYYPNNSYCNWAYRLDKRTLYTNISILAMPISSSCYGLFVDISNTLYCSLTNLNQVIKLWLNDTVTISTKIAGTGIAGSGSDMLNNPQGIFVDVNFDLYVADYYNNRIQLFHLGQSIGLTVAGSGASGTITLNYPTGIALDADKYLFIVDRSNHRIIGSGLNGFRCLVGCSGGGVASNQLLNPWTFSFR